MKFDFCVACGNTDIDSIEHHHLVPKSDGGTDHEENLISLCYECHGKIHGMLRKNIRELTRIGLQKAKERGIKLGGNRANIINIQPQGASASLLVRQKTALKFNKRILNIIDIFDPLREMSLSKIASELNNLGEFTIRGAQWTPTQVMRVQKLR